MGCFFRGRLPGPEGADFVFPPHRVEEVPHGPGRVGAVHEAEGEAAGPAHGARDEGRMDAAAQFGKVNLAVGYGQFNSGDYTFRGAGADVKEAGLKDQDVFYAKADADLGVVDVYANYISLQEQAEEYGDMEVWGVGVVVLVQDFRVFGEYWQNTTADSYVEDTAWNAGIGYGKRDLKKVGSWQLDVAYNDVGGGMYAGGTGLQTDILDTLTTFNSGSRFLPLKEVKFWNAIGEVTLMQNMYLHAEYAFAADGDSYFDESDDVDDTWTVSLNYVF